MKQSWTRFERATGAMAYMNNLVYKKACRFVEDNPDRLPVKVVLGRSWFDADKMPTSYWLAHLGGEVAIELVDGWITEVK